MSVFKRGLQRYGRTPEPETPYQRAGQLWDERIGSARVQARNWRLVAFGCLTLSGGLAVGNIWQSLQSRVTPYVVEVDRLGEARSVAPAIQNYQPADGEIAWYLGRFVTDLRSVSTDPVLVKRNWLEAYDFATIGRRSSSTIMPVPTTRSRRSASTASRSRSPASCARPTPAFRSSGRNRPMSAAASPAPRAGRRC